jgi:hypothetical protein
MAPKAKAADRILDADVAWTYLSIKIRLRREKLEQSG